MFGMINAGAVAHRVVKERLCADDPTCRNYSDEVLQAHHVRRLSTPEDDAAADICNVFRRAAANNIVLQADKTQLAQTEIEVFKFRVREGHHQLTIARMQAIANFPRPATPTQLVSFLALAAHYRDYIPLFANMSSELRRGVHRGNHLVWDAAGDAVFNRLRAAFGSALELTAVRLDEPFYMRFDASGHGLSYTVRQFDEQNRLQIVMCGGRATRDYEKNYGAPDLECAAALEAFRKLPHWIAGGRHPL
jgi:hypothetical protein